MESAIDLQNILMESAHADFSLSLAPTHQVTKQAAIVIHLSIPDSTSLICIINAKFVSSKHPHLVEPKYPFWFPTLFCTVIDYIHLIPFILT